LMGMKRSPPGGLGRQLMSRLTPAVAWIIGIELGCFLLMLFAGKGVRADLAGWLILTPEGLARGHAWKVVSTVLVSVGPDGSGGLAFLFDVLMLWMFVPVLEGFWGTRRFVIFFAATAVFGNLVAAVVGLLIGQVTVPVMGVSGFIYASIAAFGVAFANQPVQFFGVIPIKGRVLAIGITGFLLLFTVLNQDWVVGAGFFGAMGLAVAITTGIWQPNVWWLKWRRWRLRRRYQVIDGGAPRDRDRDRAKKRYLN
jgi:membrane associated rhomboid family serine protease